jgi:hypothetical protein
MSCGYRRRLGWSLSSTLVRSSRTHRVGHGLGTGEGWVDALDVNIRFTSAGIPEDDTAASTPRARRHDREAVGHGSIVEMVVGSWSNQGRGGRRGHDPCCVQASVCPSRSSIAKGDPKIISKASNSVGQYGQSSSIWTCHARDRSCVSSPFMDVCKCPPDSVRHGCNPPIIAARRKNGLALTEEDAL